MNVAVNDWVMRVGYPTVNDDFPQTFENVLPCATYLVVGVDEEREAIRVQVIHDRMVEELEFWAGNFRKVRTEIILASPVNVL